ncbi:fumarylacetoacetate hydrolase family protein [Herbiconiux sp. KACC 21604]|uniref:fumarylacetoacetate hydrolase family protein n=1 Tax=unclassified Herbiconiux TaxID=2618217 RepID=UPI0014921D24|nr:fumarylacetoacetate hydrolase family protein [Herbiconiux sp. SALV-R1]QJU52569.1 fumarylacetoacetate hydrolase family protein [Herbiconiux sp. SALV-R1]WPO87451.1 fumarylacetoacetate hydrolase family protein [Herbiconiux sp. KACC 21604]
MRLISIDRTGFAAAALVTSADDGTELVLPVIAAGNGAGTGSTVPVSMNDLLDDWQFWAERLKAVQAEAAPEDWRPIGDFEVLAPVPHPRSVICIGLNYRDHATETGAPIPTQPVVFAKHRSSVVAGGTAITLPESSDEVDYEAELAVVIGRRVFDVTPQEALRAVAGYTVMNDVSARDWQARTSQWMTAKSFPTFGPMGPALVTADELGDARGLRIGLRVNGETLQNSSTDEMIFGVAELISHLSQFWPIEPGDVIATGTPAGVGFTRTPPVFLRDGDVVEAYIEGIGVLRNAVVRDAEVPTGALHGARA